MATVINVTVANDPGTAPMERSAALNAQLRDSTTQRIQS